MSQSRSPSLPRETPSWALSWNQDRRDDRRRLQLALGFAFLLHAALLAVRFTESVPVKTPQPDAIIFPTRNVAIKEPVEVRSPEPAALPPIASPAKIPVPPELASPEPRFEIASLEHVTEMPIVAAPIPSNLEPPAAADAHPVRVSGNMVRPVRVWGQEPTYTEAGRRTRTEGVVVLDAVIDTEGRISEIEVLRSLGFGLTEAALRVVRDWRFEPATLEGRPVTVRYSLTVRFSLE